MSSIASAIAGEIGGFPTKLYTFRSYLEIMEESKDTREPMYRTLGMHPEIARDHAFAVALNFAFKGCDKPVEGIDIFSARLRDGWEGNPMYDSWTFEDGVYVPREEGTTCGTGMRIVAREEELRLTTRNLTEFMKKAIDTSDL